MAYRRKDSRESEGGSGPLAEPNFRSALSSYVCTRNREIEKEQESLQAQQGAKGLRAYRETEQERTGFTDLPTRNEQTTYSSVQNQPERNKQTCPEGMSKFEKLLVVSKHSKGTSATPTKAQRSPKSNNTKCQNDSSASPRIRCAADGHSELRRANLSKPTGDATRYPNTKAETTMSQSQGTRLPRDDKMSERTTDPRQKKRSREMPENFEKACENHIRFYRDQEKLYKAQLERHCDPSETGNVVNARLELLKKVTMMSDTKRRVSERVAAMSKEDAEMYLKLIEGFDRHRTLLALGKTALLKGPFNNHRHFKRGSIFWAPICQRAFNPRAKPDARRIPSHHGLIDDTTRLVVTIAVERWNLWVCPVTTRSGNGGEGLHNKQLWAWLQDYDVNDDKNPGFRAFKVRGEGRNRWAKMISPASLFRPELPFALQPPANYGYVGRLDEESIKRLWLPSGFDDSGYIIASDEFKIGARTESMSHVSRTSKAQANLGTFDQELSRPRKKQKINHDYESAAMPLTASPSARAPVGRAIDKTSFRASAPNTTPRPRSVQSSSLLTARYSSKSEAFPRAHDSHSWAASDVTQSTFRHPTIPRSPYLGQSQGLQTHRRNNFRGNPGRRDKTRDGVRRYDWDALGHSGSSYGSLDYGD